MTEEAGWHLKPGAAVAIALALLLTGGALTYLVTRHAAGDVATAIDRGAVTQPLDARRTATPASEAMPSDIGEPSPLPDVIVPIADDVVARAGITTSVVTGSMGQSEIRLPGVVEPNAYKQVAVTPLVSGRITEVTAQLGDRVRKGQPLVRLYSPELAEAQTRYVSARAMLEAHDRELQRTEKLVEIGAASQQELERTHAEHTAQRADVATARSRLLLFGVPAESIDGMTPGQDVSPTAIVSAPIDGVVTERLANVGLNVDPATKLVTIVDLGTVWIVADVYEKDLSRVRTGTPATIATAAFPERTVSGHVSYIDPQVAVTTRTAKVRVEVPNLQGELRLGMYVTVVVETANTAPVLSIPQTAVQQVADRQVVYLKSHEPGMFIEREVRTMSTSHDRLEVISGLQAGDVVVTAGSFFVRAERERLGLRQMSEPRLASPATAEPSQQTVQSATVKVTETGFEPSTVKLHAGVPALLTFIRATDKTCAKEIVIPSLHIRRALPLNDAVTVEFTPAKGEIGFVCGMNMLRGTVVVD
jgi:RND family efflux transporter MFP subunit